MTIEQVSLTDLVNPNQQNLNEQINDKLNLAHSNKKNIMQLIDKFKQKQYLDTYDSYREKLEDKLDISYNLSHIIALLVLIRSDLDYMNRTNQSLSLSNRVSNAKELLNQDIQAYKSISYSIGGELTALKELIAVKFPNQRYNISN